MTTVDADLLAPAAVADPYPVLAALQRTAPVLYSPRHRAWLVTRHADVADGFRDRRISSDRMRPYLQRMDPADRERVATTFAVLTRWLVFMDPPEHTRLRRLVHRAFTPRQVERLRTRIDELCHRLLDRLHDRGAVDLMGEFAAPLPATVIAEMLGAPAEDRERFTAWSHAISGVVFGDGEPGRHDRAERGMVELVDYLTAVVEDRARQPGDDLITALLRAEEEQDALTREEVVATCVLLLFAGHETTTNLIGTGTWLLLTHPRQWDRITDDPRLVGRAVEEILRYDGPTKAVARAAAEPFTWHGCDIAAGDRLLLLVPAANRDPRRFERPDEFDLDRDPSGHLGFGTGIHFCLGAPLARLEGEIALGALVQRLPELRLHTDALDWHPQLLSRGLRGLPVTWQTWDTDG